VFIKITINTKLYLIYGKYSFVLSPYDNGIDCIRTYEALILGCIVIMKKKLFRYIIRRFTCTDSR
jgi:hypothetical protein